MDFVNEGKHDEELKRRQAEWERVRKPDDPIEAPPEAFDNRTLYDKLKEQHELKKKEFEGTYALKNQVRGIDGDEAKFLSECDEIRMKREREIRMEEKKEIEAIKKATASNVPSADIPKINLSLPLHKKENKQAGLLSSAIVSKRKIPPPITAASSLLESNVVPKFGSLSKDINHTTSNTSSEDEAESKKFKHDSEKTINSNEKTSSQIVVGVLPGLGEYDSNSSSESDSSDDDDDDESDLNTSGIVSRNKNDSSAASKLTKS